MWKDFFYFSRGQRVGILVFIGVILLTVAVRFTLPLFFKSEPVWTTKQFQSQVDSFLSQVKTADSVNHVRFKNNFKFAYSSEKLTERKNLVQLSAFDPNSTDSIGLIRLGIRPYVVKNILKFRSKGGKFKTPEDFSRVYGIETGQFNQLKPYINIKPLSSDTLIQQQVKRKEIEDKMIFVELNSADTSMLMQIKGIGRYLASSIVRFRQLSGGFVDVRQLKEIKGFTEEHFIKISPFCQVDASKVNRIRVNIASVDKLKSHPYLGFYKARSLYEYRRKVGRLKNIDEIGELDDFSPEDIEKLKPYLSFE